MAVVPTFAKSADETDSGGCTTAVVAGSGTPSGRPLLWKNRDQTVVHQEVAFFRSPRFSFVGIINAGDTTQVWGGLNSAGFAVVDADNANTPDTVAGADDDGRIMKHALANCQSVADFQALLDSTSVAGHTRPAMFGVIDAFGGAAYFETFAHGYVRYDAAAAPRGILVRANFSYAGDAGNQPGRWRHDRALSLLATAQDEGMLEARTICARVVRDLRPSAAFDPYPLPFRGQCDSLPDGWIPFAGAVCNRFTQSACVIEGVRPGENPLLATFWGYPMNVVCGVAIPFWVAAQTTPPETDGNPRAPLCDAGLNLRLYTMHGDTHAAALDTRRLTDGYGGGIQITTGLLEARFFARADSALTVWRTAGVPSGTDAAVLSAQCAAEALQVLQGWLVRAWPPAPLRRPSAVTIAHSSGHIVLRWPAVTADTLGRFVAPVVYQIRRGSSLAVLAQQRHPVAITDETEAVFDATEASGFFDVNAVCTDTIPTAARAASGQTTRGR